MVKINLALTDLRVVTFLALTACFLWGSAFPGVKYGYALLGIAPKDPASQLVFAGFRFTLAGLMVLFIAQISGRSVFSFSFGEWLKTAGLGLLITTLQYSFFYPGLANTTGVKGAIITATGIFFNVILSHFLFRNDRLNICTIIGCFTGFLGVVAVNYGTFNSGFSFSARGELFLVIASFLHASGNIYGKILSQSINPVLMTGWQLFIGGMALTGLGFAGGGSPGHFNLPGVLLLGYLAFLSAAAFVIFAELMKHNPVSRVSIFSFSIPLFGAALSAIFLDEKLLEMKNLTALILVSSGIWLVTTRGRK